MCGNYDSVVYGRAFNEHVSHRDAICSVETIAVGDRKSVHNLEGIGQRNLALAKGQII
jgi:hypothetical protein